MTQLTLEMMWKTFLELVTSSCLPLLVACGLTLFLIVLLKTNDQNRVTTRRIYIICYLVVIALIIGFNFQDFLGLGNYLMDNLFVMIYFPNLVVYLIMIIITNGMMIRTCFSTRPVDKTKKILNVVAFALIHFLLFLILNVVHTDQVSILDETAIYQNDTLLAMIQLSMGVFAVWMLILFTRYVLEKLSTPAQQAEMIAEKEEVIQDATWEKVPTPKVAYELVRTQPKVAEKKEQEEPFTLEEYQKVLELLEEIRKRDRNEEKKEH